MPYLTPDNAPTNVRGIVVFIPDDDEYLHLLLGALDYFRFEENWQQHGDATPQEVSELWGLANDDTATENLYS